MAGAQGVGEPPLLRFALSGPVFAWHHGDRVDLGPPQRRAVLAMLLLAAGRVVGADELIAGVWGEDPPPRVAAALQAHVSVLRRVLEPGRKPRQASRVLRSVDRGYAVDPTGSEVDLFLFRSRRSSARASLSAGRFTEGSNLLSAALQGWDGSALVGIPGPAADLQRSILQMEAVGAVEELLELRAGTDPAALPLDLPTLLREHPHRESLHALAMRALHAAGRRADALEVYTELRRTLVADLGIEPGPRVRALQRAILAEDSLATGELPAVRPLAQVTRREPDVSPVPAPRSGPGPIGAPSAPVRVATRDQPVAPVGSFPGAASPRDVGPGAGPEIDADVRAHGVPRTTPATDAEAEAATDPETGADARADVGAAGSRTRVGAPPGRPPIPPDRPQASAAFAAPWRSPLLPSSPARPGPALIGRAEVLDRLTAALVPGAPRPVLLHGPVGVGTTALAVEAVAAAIGRFSGGMQIAGVGSPAPPRPGSLLIVDGVHAEHQLDERLDVPPGAGVSLLQQLSGSGTTVLVTGTCQLRRLLPAQRLDVSPLTLEQSSELLTRHLGAERVDAEPEVARQLLRRIGGLPALVVASAQQLAVRSSWTLAEYADDLLALERDDPEWFTDVTLGPYVRHAFAPLPVDALGMLACCAELEYADFGRDDVLVGGVAHVDALLLDVLVDHHLLAEPGPGRYRLHPLIRRYVRMLSRASGRTVQRPRAAGPVAVDIRAS